jgi:hypothetical protein
VKRVKHLTPKSKKSRELDTSYRGIQRELCPQIAAPRRLLTQVSMLVERWHEIQTYCMEVWPQVPSTWFWCIWHRVGVWRALEFPAEYKELIRCDGAKGSTERKVDHLARWLGSR